jgi:hypothetical protein
VRGGRPRRGRLALGRQPAEGRDRARARRGPAGHDRRAAHARLDVGAIEFVHTPPGRRARRGPRGAARLARARGGPLARRPDPRDLRGPHRRRAAADGHATRRSACDDCGGSRARETARGRRGGHAGPDRRSDCRVSCRAGGARPCHGAAGASSSAGWSSRSRRTR